MGDCRSGQFGETPECVGQENTEDAGHHQRALFRFQQVGTDSGNKDKQEGYGDQLKTQPLVMGSREAQKEAESGDQQGRGVSEIAGSGPQDVSQ